MHNLIETIRSQAERDREKILASLRAYVKRGKLGEDAVQALFGATAEALGCTVTFYDYHPADVALVEEFAEEAAIDPQPRRSVVAHRKGTGGGRSLILFAHPDSEPVPVTPGWRHDPFAGDIVDGRMYGWGIADDLSGIAAGLQALELLYSLDLLPAGDIYIANTPSKRHARGVARLLQEGLSADAVVYLHPAAAVTSGSTLTITSASSRLSLASLPAGPALVNRAVPTGQVLHRCPSGMAALSRHRGHVDKCQLQRRNERGVQLQKTLENGPL